MRGLAIVLALAACHRGGDGVTAARGSAGSGSGSGVITQIEIEPRAKPVEAPPEEAGRCPRLHLSLSPATQSLEVGPKNHLTVPYFHDGAIDAPSLERALAGAKQNDCTAIEVFSEPGVRYEAVIQAMDLCVKVGLMDVGLDSGAPASSSASGSADPLPAGSGNAMADAQVVVVTRDELRLGDKPFATIAEVTAGGARIAKLTAALPPAKVRSLVILQADKSTDMLVINRIVGTLQSLRYDDVMFAVKKQ